MNNLKTGIESSSSKIALNNVSKSLEDTRWGGHNLYLDFLRSVAIIFVVIIHTFSIDYSSVISVLFGNLVGCAVPLFLALSGYLTYKKRIETKEQYIAFIFQRLKRVWIPMLIWGFPYFILMLKHGNPIYDETLKWMSGYNLVFYFVALIMQCYLIYPLVRNSKNAIWYSMLLFYCWELFKYFFIPVDVLRENLLLRSGMLPSGLFYFCIGISCTKRQWNSTILLLLAFIGFIIEFYCRYRYGLGITVLIPAIASLLIAPLVLGALSLTNRVSIRVGERYFYMLSKYSFFIYLFHFYIILYLPIPEELWFYRFLSCVFIAFIIAWIIDRFLPKNIKIYLGI